MSDRSSWNNSSAVIAKPVSLKKYGIEKSSLREARNRAEGNHAQCKTMKVWHVGDWLQEVISILAEEKKKRNGHRYDLWDFILKHDNEEEL